MPLLVYVGCVYDSCILSHPEIRPCSPRIALAPFFVTFLEYASLRGVHADYGYLLFKQGKADEAIAELQEEAALYPESKPLMETMVSRIQGQEETEKEKKPTQ